MLDWFHAGEFFLYTVFLDISYAPVTDIYLFGHAESLVVVRSIPGLCLLQFPNFLRIEGSAPVPG